MQMRDEWVDRMLRLAALGDAQEPEKKVFKPKLTLPRLSDYSQPAPSWFWNIFPNNFVTPAQPKIDGNELKNLALQYGYPDRETLDKVFNWIEKGADIGCTGKFRKPSRAKNAPSAYKEGYKVTDAIGKTKLIFERLYGTFICS